MLIEFKVSSLFLPDKRFKAEVSRSKLAPLCRFAWRFVSNGLYPAFRHACCKEQVAEFLDMDKELVFPLLRDELAQDEDIAGVLLQDGLYCHPEALGKVLLKLKMRSLESQKE